MDGDSSVVSVEHGNEFESCTQRFEVLAERGHTEVFEVFEFRDCSLGDLESTRTFYLADRFAEAELIGTDLFESFVTAFSEAFMCTRA